MLKIFNFALRGVKKMNNERKAKIWILVTSMFGGIVFFAFLFSAWNPIDWNAILLVFVSGALMFVPLTVILTVEVCKVAKEEERL